MSNTTVPAAAPGLPSITAVDRRTFLRGVAPAAALAVAAAPVSAAVSPEEQARHAWQEFSAAMRALTVDADGWTITASENRQRGNRMELRRVEMCVDPLFPNLRVENHRKIEL